MIPDTNTLPFTNNLEVGFVVPIPKEPVEELKDNAVEPMVAIPMELTPELDANVGNTGWAICTWASTLTPFIPVKFDPSPK